MTHEKIINMVCCIHCKNYGIYTTGADEYPQNTCISFCSKGHWENGSPFDDEEEQIECTDFIQARSMGETKTK